jgi:hypothetical protein
MNRKVSGKLPKLTKYLNDKQKSRSIQGMNSEKPIRVIALRPPPNLGETVILKTAMHNYCRPFGLDAARMGGNRHALAPAHYPWS